MKYITDNSRILSREELSSPEEITNEIPLDKESSKLIFGARRSISQVLHRQDDRLIVVVGPCSIHDPKSAIEYAQLLKDFSNSVEDELVLVMRVYFEKPRTTIGWKGLINDPRIDNSFKINEGLRVSRKLLKDIADLGMPTGTEFLDLISPQYVSDLVSWGAIGARTAESQVHRELTSGLSCPMGIKNSTKGDIQVAIDALKSAQYQHVFLGTTKKGKVAIFKTSGNDDTHIILRGGIEPNFYPEDVQNCEQALQANDVHANVMIDFSHGNSKKNHENQKKVCASVCTQINEGNKNIIGVMIESHLKEGAQKISDNLEYGKSITDACVHWEETKKLLNDLASSVKARRQLG
jgi:3-deoxy-7-phosphoheptulonate synthase